MIDLKILSIRDLLPLTGVRYATGVTPLSVIITGSNLNQASEVLLNDVTCPQFAVLSANQIIAQVPTSQRSSVLRKAAAIAETPSVNRTSLLHFEVGQSIKGIAGLEKLIQAFCKLLLQTPGSDRFRPSDGGGLLQLTGRTVSKGDSKSLQASVVSCVSRTQDQLISRQNTNRNIPSDERLLSASATAVGFDTTTTTLSAQISLSAVSGKQAVANLTL